jgi:serine protease Do
MDKQLKLTLISAVLVSTVVSTAIGGAVGFYAGAMADSGSLSDLRAALGLRAGEGRAADVFERSVTVTEDSATIDVIEKANPAVISIIVTKDLPVIEQYYQSSPGGDLFRQFFGDDFGDSFGYGVPRYRQNGTEKQEVGGGSGFIVSPDGFIITNRHVVTDEEAEYTVLMNDETKVTATVLARDTVNDLAILKIDKQNLPYLELGDSGNLKVGQRVIAIGNALGEYRNTVSTGVISGLSRSVVTGGSGEVEQLSNVIQTDASINPGNSGGPLLNIAGQVIGINTAIVSGAQNIGFAIPVNDIKQSYESVKRDGRIVRPFLGVRYTLVNEVIKEANKLTVDHGALLIRGETPTDLAVMPGSPADKAGLKENDIILEADGKEIDDGNPLAKAIAAKQPGDELTLKVLSQGEERTVKVRLEEMK